MDVIEINEAFAAQTLACLRALGIADDAPHVNPMAGQLRLVIRRHVWGAIGADCGLNSNAVVVVSALHYVYWRGSGNGIDYRGLLVALSGATKPIQLER